MDNTVKKGPEGSYKKSLSKFETKPKHNYPPGEAKILEVPNPLKIRVRNFFGNQDNQVFTLKFNNNDKLLATGTIDGEVKIYDVVEGKNTAIAKSWSKSESSTTSVRWRPKRGEVDPHYLVATSSEGSVTWLKSTGEVIERISTDSPVMCCDYLSSAQGVVIGKENFGIEVIHDDTKSPERIYEGSTTNNQNKNHSNRVFAIKCLPQPTQFISGGWDSNIKIWDTREKESVRTIYGPHLSGDSLDYRDGVILTGSYRNSQILQLWDFGTGKLMETIDLGLGAHQACYCYAAQMSEELIATGLSVCNQVMVCKRGEKNRVCGKIQLHDTCYSLDISKGGKLMALGGAEGVIYILSI